MSRSSLRNAEQSIRNEDVESLGNLIEENLTRDPNYPSFLLHIAAKQSSFKICSWLLNEKGVDVNYRLKEDNRSASRPHSISPLEASISAQKSGWRQRRKEQDSNVNENHEQIECVKLLISKGADLASRNESLLLAATQGRSDLIQILIDSNSNVPKIDVNYRDQLNGNTALLCTTLHFQSHLDCIQLLLNLGADVNASNHQGNNALHRLVAKPISSNDSERAKKVEDAIRIFIEKGININATNQQGDTPLIKASRQGNATVVSMLLPHLTTDQILTVNKQGFNAIHQAAIWCHSSVLRIFLEKVDRSIVVDTRDTLGNTVLHLVGDQLLIGKDNSNYNDYQESLANFPENSTNSESPIESSTVTSIVKMLLDAGADVTAVNHNNETPLHNVNVPWEKLRMLLEHSNKVNGTTSFILLSKEDKNSLTPFVTAVKMNKIEHVDQMLKEVSDNSEQLSLLNSVKSKIDVLPKEGSNILHSAVHNVDYYRTVELLLQHGGLSHFINAKNQKGFTPLHIAIENDQSEYVKLLLNHGADIEVRITPSESQKGTNQIIDSMIRSYHLLNPHESTEGLHKEDDVKESSDSSESTLDAFEFALESGSLFSLLSLLEFKYSSVQENIRQSHEASKMKEKVFTDGNGLLHKAVSLGSVDAVVKLIEWIGMDPNTPNREMDQFTDGGTPLHIGAQTDRVECMKVLIKHGAQINSKENYDGNTPLHLAARFGCLDAIKFLSENGADSKIENNEGETPIDLAQYASNADECLELLTLS